MYTNIELLFQTTIDRNPECWMVHRNFGLLLAGRGQFDEAIAHYRNAIEFKPDYVEAHIDLGVALAGRGKTDEAIAHFQKAQKSSQIMLTLAETLRSPYPSRKES